MGINVAIFKTTIFGISAMYAGIGGALTGLLADFVAPDTYSLFFSILLLAGAVMGDCHGLHRHQEFLKFLRQLHSAFPRWLDLHLILDNYGTHKHPTVRG